MTNPDTRALLAANHQQQTPDTPAVPGCSVTLTEQQAADAFAAWERAYREAPADFLTRVEVERLEVADVATQSAIYFMALLRKGGAT